MPTDTIQLAPGVDTTSIVTHLLGPNGGVFAFGLICGMVIMYLANMKMITPWVNKAHEAEIKALEAKLEAHQRLFEMTKAALEARIATLESTEKEYHQLLIKQAKGECRD